MQLTLFFVVLCVWWCSASQTDEMETCLVKYLQWKGKLSNDFQTPITLSREECKSVNIADNLKGMKHEIDEVFQTEYERYATCLQKEFGEEQVDDYLKMGLLKQSKFLSDTVKQTQIDETKKQLKEKLEVIAQTCETGADFVTSFLTSITDAIGN